MGDVDGTARAGNNEARALFPPVPPYATAEHGEYTRPELPTDTFVLFGEIHSRTPGIPPLHVQTEFDKVDGKIAVKEELLKLHKRLTQAVDELLEALCEDPQSYARRVELVGLLFRNMQYLLNILREKQATATTLDLLRHKIREKQDCLAALGG
jgi:hypothetical protein